MNACQDYAAANLKQFRCACAVRIIRTYWYVNANVRPNHTTCVKIVDGNIQYHFLRFPCDTAKLAKLLEPELFGSIS